MFAYSCISLAICRNYILGRPVGAGRPQRQGLRCSC